MRGDQHVAGGRQRRDGAELAGDPQVVAIAEISSVPRLSCAKRREPAGGERGEQRLLAAALPQSATASAGSTLVSSSAASAAQPRPSSKPRSARVRCE